MNDSQTEPFDPAAIQWPAFQSYLGALRHMAPEGVRVFRESEKDSAGPVTEGNPRVTIAMRDRRDAPVTVAVEFPKDAPGSFPQPVWRLPSLVRMMEAMAMTIGGVYHRPFDSWPSDVEMIWEAITGRFQNDISLGLLASELNKSDGYLGDRFLQFTGSAFRQLLSEERIAFAVRQLLGTSRTVDEIAKGCGLSLSRLNRIFASTMGMSPRDCRKTRAVPKLVFRK